MSLPLVSAKSVTRIQAIAIAIGLATVVVVLAGFPQFLDTTYSPTTPSLHLPLEDLKWTVEVNGLVSHHLNLSIEEITMMPRSTVNATLYCLPSPAAATGSLVDFGNWSGVRLGLVLEKAGVLPGTVKIAFYAKDGFTTDLTITAAMNDDIIIAYEKDGEALPQKLRLVVPGRWGYKWIHGLIRIEAVNYDFRGLYESRGFPDNAEIT
jgi:DMSO/TMAO reductase YedYZ molybdopterin-dependent catalytic subunit